MQLCGTVAEEYVSASDGTARAYFAVIACTLFVMDRPGCLRLPAGEGNWFKIPVPCRAGGLPRTKAIYLWGC